MGEWRRDDCTSGDEKLSASNVTHRGFVEEIYVVPNECPPGKLLDIAVTPNVVANRRTAPVRPEDELCTGPGSCLALIDTRMQAALLLESDWRKVT